MSQHGDTVVMEMTAEQAFDMFAQAMDQVCDQNVFLAKPRRSNI